MIFIVLVMFGFGLVIKGYRRSIEGIQNNQISSFGNNITIFLYPFYISFLYYYLIYFSGLMTNNPRMYFYFFGCTMSVVLIKFLIARISR